MERQAAAYEDFMAKIKVIDVQKLGFTEDMFSVITNLSGGSFESLIQEIIDENVDEIKDEISETNYDDPNLLDDVKRIEKLYAAAELWDRRASIVAGMAVPDGPDGSTEEKRAEKQRKRAQKIMNRLTGDDEPVFSSSVEESEH